MKVTFQIAEQHNNISMQIVVYINGIREKLCMSECVYVCIVEIGKVCANLSM